MIFILCFIIFVNMVNIYILKINYNLYVYYMYMNDKYYNILLLCIS